MVSNVELLPLPKHSGKATDMFGQKTKLYSGIQMQDYARANVEHHTTALENKYDDLWAVKETYREKVGVLEQMLEGTNTFCEKATAAKDAEIKALRAEREVICAEAVKYADKSGRLEAKVDQLAEALGLAMDWNWLDEDARPSRTAEICDAALDPTAAQEEQ